MTKCWLETGQEASTAPRMPSKEEPAWGEGEAETGQTRLLGPVDIQELTAGVSGVACVWDLPYVFGSHREQSLQASHKDLASP